MSQGNILDYFPEDAAKFEKDDVIILARVYGDNLEGQMATSLLRSQNIPNYLIGDIENSSDNLRLYIKKDDLEQVKIILQELAERKKIPVQELRTINGYSPFSTL